MADGFYRFADRIVEIQSVYNRIHKRAASYSVQEEHAEFLVSTTEEDISREKSAAEFPTSPNELEVLAVQRKLTEALLDYDTILFHSSALAVDGQGYLFAALSGTGKSTHARLWREVYGDRVVMINDDKPFIHVGKDEVRVYGTPWDGKHHLSTNTSVPVKAICILTRDTTNHIEEISLEDAFPILYQQTYRPKDVAKLSRTIDLINRMAKNVKFFRLGCNMDPEAARISFEGMQA